MAFTFDEDYAQTVNQATPWDATGATSFDVTSGASAIFVGVAAEGANAQGPYTITWDQGGGNENIPAISGTSAWNSVPTQYTEWFGKLAPTNTGTGKTCRVAFTGGNVVRLTICVVGVHGGHVSSLSVAQATNTGSGTDYWPDTTPTTTVNGDLVLCNYSWDYNTLDYTADFTAIYDVLQNGDAFGAQREERASAGSGTITWSGGIANDPDWACSATVYPIAAAGGSSLPPGSLSLLGVGA